jgi:uncharacterized protein
MKTKAIKICLTLLIVFFVTPAFASVYDLQARIIDNAGLLKPQERESLLALISSAGSTYSFDLVIVIEKNIGSSSLGQYADNFYDENHYGLVGSRDGALFLLVTDSRDYWFSTSGSGIRILNTAASDKLESGVVKLLRENNYYGAFNAFLTDWQRFLALDAKGRNYNFFHQWNLVLVIIAWVLALAVGFIVVQTWKKAMDTVLPQTQAAAYVVPGSLAFREKKDSFLYSTVSKTKLQKQSQGIASSGRGISTGSSGNRHGGRGGKF